MTRRQGRMTITNHRTTRRQAPVGSSAWHYCPGKVTETIRGLGGGGGGGLGGGGLGAAVWAVVAAVWRWCGGGMLVWVAWYAKPVTTPPTIGMLMSLPNDYVFLRRS